MENNTKLQADFDNAKNELEIHTDLQAVLTAKSSQIALFGTLMQKTPTRCFQKAKTATSIFKFLKEKDEKIYNNTDLLCK